MRILVVDDQEEGRYMLESLLKGLGHDVASTKNGVEALEKLYSENFDIIVSDILMPVMDGFQLCMQAKQSERLRGIPLVFYTATYVDEHDENLAMMMGAHAFIRKPIDPEDLAGIINRVAKELEEGKLPPRKLAFEAQAILMERYNERVVNKLHQKMQDLENEIAQRKKAEEELRDAQHVLDIRDKIAKIFLTVPDEGMYRAVLQVILEAVESAYGVFGYIDENGSYACPSMTRSLWDQCQVTGKATIFKREQWGGIWGQSLIEKRLLFSNEPLSVPGGHVPISRAVSVPIVYRDSVIGAFVLANKKTDYCERDVDLLQTLADYVAPVLDARLIREREERERRQAQEALKESEERYRIVADFTQDWDYWVGTDGGIIYMSPSCERVTGYCSQEFIDDPGLLMRIVHPDDTETVSCHLFTVRENSQLGPASFDFRIIRKDGVEQWFNHTCQGVLGSEGEPRGRRISNRNITDRKRGEESLRESERRYRLLIEESPIGIGILQDERHIYINAAFVKVFGYESASEILNRPPEQLVASEENGLIFQQGEDLAADRLALSHYELKGLRKNGEVFDLFLWPRRIDYFGRPATLTFVADRTEAKTLRAQLFQAQKMEAIGALAGGIAHDFNNLLQVVIGYTDLLLMRTTQGAGSWNELQEISHAARSGAELIQGLLTFSRKTETHLRPVNLNHCVGRVNKLLLRTIFKTTKVDLLLDDKLATISADPTQLEQVLMNLAVNARDAMPEGGTLCVQTQNVTLGDEYCRLHLGARPGQYAMLSLSDTGHGMDRATVDRIFEPFFSTKGPGKGTGLGLSIVYGIVKQHGGHIDCYSQIGCGTTFRVYFPVIGRLAGVDTAMEKPVLRGGTETILVVDDEGPVRDFCKDCLRTFGYHVITAASGQEALDLYSQLEGDIALVILDLIMPDMNGQQCLDGLRKINSQVKVIIATGHLEEAPAKEIFETGTQGFLKKPYDVKQLLEVVRHAIN